jgi:cytochrome c5
MKQSISTLLLTITLTLLAMTALADNSKGQGVYMNFCSSCHASGIAGAPKTGDKGAWTMRLQQDEKILIEHAVKGYQGKHGYMPAKGGNSALTDEEVAAAVKYMAEQSR